MKQSIVALAVLAALGCGLAQAKTLTIGIDLSSSNPVVGDAAFARSAAAYAQTQVAALQPGDVVEVRTFGDRSLANVKAERVQISRRAKADKVAAKIARFIAGLPASNPAVQGSTNIVAFLEFGQFDCASGGTVLLLTDGIESSEYVDANRFLAGKPLPKPEKNFLSGCAVTMVGLGQALVGELTPQQTKHVRTAWQTWMKAAGARFESIINP